MKKLLVLIALLFFVSPAYAEDAALTQKVENYLNNISTLSADFSQVDGEGNISGGKFFLKRPGKFKWEYDERQPVLIVSDGSQIVYYDKTLKESSYAPAGSTLAGLIAHKNIKFSGDIKLVSIGDKDGIIAAKVVQRGKPDQGALTMFFSDKDMKLTNLEVQDANGYVTKITFSNTRTGQEIADNNFIFHDPKNFKNVWEKN